jgi:Spy/CpxP family protein refolding chaperone
MKNKLLIGSAAVLGTLALAAGVFASTGSNSSDNNNSYAWMNQMHQAMLSGDYNTWKTTADQYGMGQMMRNVNQANFSQMQQMHELMLQGNYNEANDIHRNLTGYDMMGSAGGRGMMGF